MKHEPCAAAQLKRLLGLIFANFGGETAVEEAVSRRWASITFSGARHLFTLRLEGAGAAAAADAFVDHLEEREFRLRGHVVADIVLVAAERDGDAFVRLRLEALTVEEA